MTAHALLSASGAHRWMNCPGSVALEKDLPDETSTFAEEGTAAHELASWCLQLGTSPWEYEGHAMRIVNGKHMSPAELVDFFRDGGKIKTDNSYVVDQEMIENIQSYIDVVNDFTPPGAQRFIEKRVDFSHYIGVENSFGTSDVIIIHKDEICIADLKYGMGVQVDAENNPQLMLYALGALKRYELLADFKRVRMVIHQPRINHLSEWDCSVEELLEFGRSAKNAAALAITPSLLLTDKTTILNPGTKQCRWCRAKSFCPALAAQATALIADDFVDLDKEEATLAKLANAVEVLPSTQIDRLSVMMKGADLVEIWIKGVREAVYAHLARGEKVKGFKLVRGKEGNRKWKDEASAVAALKQKLKEDELYKKSLITPPDAEKKLKKEKAFWNEMMQDHISRSEGKLSVAPESDKREPVNVEELVFEDLAAGEE